MDDKTVIAGKAASDPPDPSRPPVDKPPTEPAEEDANATIIAPSKPVARVAKKAAKPADDKPAGAKAGPAGKGPKDVAKPAPQAARPAGPLVYVAMAGALIFLGLGSAVTTIYLFAPNKALQQVAVTDKDLQANLVPVAGEDSEAEDEAVIRAAIKPRIIDLSGDPVIVPQLASAPRQLIKLASDTQRKAAGSLGIKNDVFRLKDVLDLPTPQSQAAVLGSQDDIAMAQEAPAATGAADSAPSADDAAGSSSIAASSTSTGDRVADFAQKAKAPIRLTDALKNLGLDAARAGAAADAFNSFYSRPMLQSEDRYVVRAVAENGDPNHMEPVQVSVYAKTELVGSIALNDVGAYVRAEDPWYQRDPFEAPLAPVQVDPENQPRLLDAIYVTALRNRLPSPVIGEAIMLLSRAQDLEQKVQPGDTISLIYSPAPRDSKQGLGRIVFVSIGRTSGNLDCYVMQPQAGAPFQCVSSAGQASVPDNGMVTPVNGSIVARFGPQGTDSSASASMNYGIDWTAPAGSPVVAAYPGKVTAIGEESGFGTVVRLSHDDGKSSMYGYLARAATGLTVGASVQAGEAIGYVGTPASSREPRLHFEIRNNGVPVDPVADSQVNTAASGAGASTGGGANGAVDQFVGRIITIESGNKCNAANPLSTAVGLGQFIESTWMTTIRLHRPDLLAGRSRQEVLAMRTNCDLARAMTTALTRDNAAVVRQAGHTVTPGNLYLAHFLGSAGAVKALKSPQDQQISSVFGAAHVRANPFEAGKTISYLIAWAAKKMGAAISGSSSPSQDTSTTPANNEPLAKFATDPAFAALKTSVLALLQ
ncbi:M23 family metallopeptidase [Labrys neptuniae]